ncbi:EXOS2 protein, partial [Polypterus senegalus]
MRLPAPRKRSTNLPKEHGKHLVAPGDVITTDSGFMRFNGEVGDVVVGRITEAEVQSVFADGALSLHTRSLKYGKLGQGVLVQVSPSLIKRRKTHFHNLTCGASIILGNNGYVWIYPTPAEQNEEAGGFVTNTEPVPLSDREVISRLRNCILALSVHKMLLYDTSILYCYESAFHHQVMCLIQDSMSNTKSNQRYPRILWRDTKLEESSLHLGSLDSIHVSEPGSTRTLKTWTFILLHRYQEHHTLLPSDLMSPPPVLSQSVY